MNDVQQFYERARSYFPDALPWDRLSPFQQMQVVQGINLILGVMSEN
jgi:hypothetical protein